MPKLPPALPLAAAPAPGRDDLAGRDLPPWDAVLVAHRRLAPGLPENTMAFEDTAARGVGAIEIDPHGTGDGEIVVMHDETVDRATDGTGAVTGPTPEEARALDAGSQAGDAFAGERVPTHEEVLALAAGRGITLPLDIELSPTLDRERIMRPTEEHDAVPGVVVGVRSLGDLAEVRSPNPNPRTLGSVPDLGAIGPFAEAGVEIIRLRPEWIRGGNGERRRPIPAFVEGVENCLVEWVRPHGRPVWTTAGKAGRAELIELMEAGVAGILADVPDGMAALQGDEALGARGRDVRPVVHQRVRAGERDLSAPGLEEVLGEGDVVARPDQQGVVEHGVGLGRGDGRAARDGEAADVLGLGPGLVAGREEAAVDGEPRVGLLEEPRGGPRHGLERPRGRRRQRPAPRGRCKAHGPGRRRWRRGWAPRPGGRRGARRPRSGRRWRGWPRGPGRRRGAWGILRAWAAPPRRAPLSS